MYVLSGGVRSTDVVFNSQVSLRTSSGDVPTEGLSVGIGQGPLVVVERYVSKSSQDAETERRGETNVERGNLTLQKSGNG